MWRILKGESTLRGKADTASNCFELSGLKGKWIGGGQRPVECTREGPGE